MSLNFGIPHSCQTYWWGTSGFFQTILSCIQGHSQSDYYHPTEDINQLTELFLGLTTEQQSSLIETLNNLISMTNELGNKWVHPHNRENDPILEQNIKNYKNLETTFYNIIHSFVWNPIYTTIIPVITRILRRYEESGTRFYSDFLRVFDIQ
jgi:hypothetical protein